MERILTVEVAKLLRLLDKASKDMDNIADGVIGYDGYGFLFRGFDFEVNIIRSSGFSHIHTSYEDQNVALYHAGALKTLVPSLTFGGDEVLFDVWVLVKTPKGEILPLSFYFGASGLTLGASKLSLIKDSEDLPVEYRNAVNCDPFELGLRDRELLTTALGRALSKVPTTDFEGVFRHDGGSTLMSLIKGVPSMEELNDYELEHFYKRPNETWTYDITGCSDYRGYYNDLVDIIFDNSSSETRSENFSKVVNICIDKLMVWVRHSKSRLAYQILGKSLMFWAADVSDELKKEILENTKWKFERVQLRNKQDRMERKKYLFEFRAELLAYKNGQEILLSRQMKPDGRKRQSIDHRIH